MSGKEKFSLGESCLVWPRWRLVVMAALNSCTSRPPPSLLHHHAHDLYTSPTYLHLLRPTHNTLAIVIYKIQGHCNPHLVFSAVLEKVIKLVPPCLLPSLSASLPPSLYASQTRFSTIPAANLFSKPPLPSSSSSTLPPPPTSAGRSRHTRAKVSPQRLNKTAFI